MKKLCISILAALAIAACSAPRDGEYTLHLLTTNDVHGTYFDSTYVGTRTRPSLLAVNTYVDSVRSAVGAQNVLLLDAGDFLQGDNAAYYYNYVDSTSTHIYPRIAAYMGYDVIVGGNHDIETGHPVYDRVASELNSFKIPFLAGNAIRNDDGKPYFQVSTMLDKAGLKVAVLGFDNANIKAWLNESLWSGMHFESLLPLVQQEVDKVIAREKPQVVIAAVHSGTGHGDGSQLESQGLDLYNTLRGVDFVVCAHDHRPVVFQNDSICLINAGSHSRTLGHGTITVRIEKGKVVGKTISGELIPVAAEKADAQMRSHFQPDYDRVREFTVRKVGELAMDLSTRDAFTGMSDYINFVHSVQIGCHPAQISFAAPLKFNGFVGRGDVLYNDLFTIYPFENQLYVVKMTGEQIRNYLEYSYDSWIQTISSPADHVLRIHRQDDPRNGHEGWSFVNRSYNFDSAAGINYTVDVTKPFGERIAITTMATGEPFDITETYNVAMTSYRASGGGDMMREGAGIDTDNIDALVVEKYPEIRELVYDWFVQFGTVTPESVSDPAVIGKWSFVPEKMASQALASDMALLFGNR